MIKNPNYLIIILIIIKIITTIAIMIVITTILIIILIIIVMIKWRNTCRTLTAPNTELSVTCDIQRPKRRSYHKSSTSDASWVLYAHLKQLIQHLRWLIRVYHAAWIPCLELSSTWFLKNNHNGNINKHNCNNNSNNVITRLKQIEKKGKNGNSNNNNNNNNNNKRQKYKKII